MNFAVCAQALSSARGHLTVAIGNVCDNFILTHLEYAGLFCWGALKRQVPRRSMSDRRPPRIYSHIWYEKDY